MSKNIKPTICIDSDNKLSVLGTGKITVKSSIEIAGTNTVLPIECTADFSNVPSHLHEIYLNSFRYSFGSRVGIENNSKEQPKKGDDFSFKIKKIVSSIFKFKND